MASLDPIVGRRLLRELVRTCIDLVLPGTCPACGAPSPGLCRICRAHLVVRGSPSCRRCGEPVVPGVPCTADHRPLTGLGWVQSPVGYAGSGGAMVRRLKFDGDRGALLFLARRMTEVVRPMLRGGFRRPLLVPVPLHRRRRRQRGLDQAALLAGAVGDRLGLAVAPGVLCRTRATVPQGDPRVTSRAANVAGAFVLRRPAAVDGASVLLVDDVFTSGSTLRECARVLRAGGARAVAALTATRA